MGHGHGHGHHHAPNERNIFFSVLLNLIITIAEFAGGILSNSLALLSDAIHNLSDTLAIAISYVALKVGQKPSNEKNTFGFRRYEILTALFNSVVLIAISVYLLREAYVRFVEPQAIQVSIMLPVAIIGLLANFISILLLHHDHKHNLNIKAAYLHLLGDTVSSLGVVLGGIAMYFWGLYWIDPLVTVIIAAIIIKHAFDVVKETVNILTMATPPTIKTENIKKKLEEEEEIDNVHHMHCWRLDDHQLFFECHADLVHDLSLSKADEIRNRLEQILHDNFSIEHSTIQFEFHCCSSKKLILDH